MRMVIEFFRVRPDDRAQALLGRQTREAEDLDQAIAAARALAATLPMPQQPDRLTISGEDGRLLYSCALDADPTG